MTRQLVPKGTSTGSRTNTKMICDDIDKTVTTLSLSSGCGGMERTVIRDDEEKKRENRKVSSNSRWNSR